MKNKLILTILLLNQLILFGQTKYIELLEKSSAIENLIPNNWKVLSIAHGDLNNDGKTDVAFIIENTNAKNIQLNESNIGRPTININPRVLGIYFRNKKGELVKKLQSNDFVILQDSPTMDEPFDGMKIHENGVLKIDFKFWYSAGSWSMSNHSYTFKFKKQQFQLIGYESSERHRGTGETIDCNIDFLTGKMKILETTTNENNIEQTIENSKKFKTKTFKTIQSLGKPFQWEFEGFYI